MIENFWLILEPLPAVAAVAGLWLASRKRAERAEALLREQGERLRNLEGQGALLSDGLARLAEQNAELQRQGTDAAKGLRLLQREGQDLARSLQMQNDRLSGLETQGRQATERDVRQGEQLAGLEARMAGFSAQAQAAAAQAADAAARLQQVAAAADERHQELVNLLQTTGAAAQHIQETVSGLRDAIHRSGMVTTDKLKRVEQQMLALAGRGPMQAIALPDRTRPAWRVQDGDGNPLFEVERWTGPVNGQPVPMDPAFKRGVGLALADLVSRAPELAALQATHGARWILRFSPEVNRGLASGLYHIVPSRAGGMRAIVRSASGQFVGNGSLVAIGGLKAVELAGLGWQIAAVVTGVSYLNRIHKQLHSVGAGVHRIEDLLERERMGLARAIEKHLRGIEEHLENSEQVSPQELHAWVGQLESIELQCQALLEQAVLGQKSALEKVKQLNFGLIWNDKNALQSCQEAVRGYRQEAQMFASAVYVNLLLGRIRLLLLDGAELTAARFRRTRDEVEAGVRLHREFVRIIQDKLRVVSNRPAADSMVASLLEWANQMRSGAAINGLAEELRQCEREVNEWLGNLQKGFESASEAVEEQIKLTRNGAVLAVAFGADGSVTEVLSLPS